MFTGIRVGIPDSKTVSPGGSVPANAIYDTSASVITDSTGSIITTA